MNFEFFTEHLRVAASLIFSGHICFKVELSPSKNLCAICLIENPLKIMKNAFYFILKALFGHKIITNFSSYRKNGLIRKIRLTSKFMTSQPGLQTIGKQILPNISQNKGNHAMKFSQLIELNIRNIFLQKICRK